MNSSVSSDRGIALHGASGEAAPSVAATLPAPRLQLRWERWDGAIHSSIFDDEHKWACHYELVLPLERWDIRREIYKDGEQIGERDELVVPIKGPTIRGSETTPCTVMNTGQRYADTPYRDGCHAGVDAKLLGDLPVFVIAPDGLALLAKDHSPPENSAADGGHEPSTLGSAGRPS